MKQFLSLYWFLIQNIDTALNPDFRPFPGAEKRKEMIDEIGLTIFFGAFYFLFTIPLSIPIFFYFSLLLNDIFLLTISLIIKL